MKEPICRRCQEAGVTKLATRIVERVPLCTEHARQEARLAPVFGAIGAVEGVA